MSTMDSTTTDGGGNNLVGSFGVAAALIVLGVLGTWGYLKQFSEVAVLELPEIAEIEITPEEVSESSSVLSWVQAGEEAYAAGRIVEPKADNAMYYFRRALAESPNQDAARAGLDRVVQHLRSGVESAIFRGDWGAARTLVAQIRSIDAGDVEARLMLQRIERYESVESLTAQAERQMAGGRLTQPVGDNALESYQAVLEIEPDNLKANQGVGSIVQRLLGFAQSAALAGEQVKAQGFVDKARLIDPSAPGLAESEQLVSQWTLMVNNQRIKDKLEAASAALQAGRLTGPDSPNALALFNDVLVREPNSDAARQGRRLVMSALIERAWSQIRANEYEAAAVSLEKASVAGADEAAVAELTEELYYQRRLYLARQGEFERTHSLSELSVRRQELPEYPRGTSGEGWVRVAFTVSEAGEVVDTQVQESSDEAFNEVAVAAISRWRFKPYFVNDRPMPVRSIIRFAFEE